MSPARQTQKEATRARILEVAKRHFERDGFEVASVRAIAEDAQVATGTVLLHFSDKLSLLHASLHGDLEVAIERSSSTQAGSGLLERLSAVARPFYAYYAERPQLSRVLLRESLLAGPPWQQRFEQQAARVLGRVVQLVEEAQAGGELPRSLPPRLVSAAFASFYYFALIGWVQGNVPEPLKLFEALMAQHLGGQLGAARTGEQP